ncbi:hypothetical protein RJ640_012241 [Escallonia rubra]|uniref:Uncharacterized protein n=1 Tax=Escallonia rubra TaxID=112253 RepID=A0AA88QIU4_9ASTE|nr:hypothetical protein RJ640_012241 [Escallonia rubra]
MASQLSEAEERERAFTSRGRWNQLLSMADAKNLLQYMFNSVAEARCQSWEKEIEIKEMEEQLKQLVGLCRQSEGRRKEVEKELKLREQALAIALATSASGNSQNSLKHFADDMSGPLSPISAPAQKHLKYTAGIANGSVRESAAFIDQTRKMVPIGQLSMKKLALVGHGGKLWRWKRSHHQWLLQFKWKWQKPWRLSELIRHSDETVMRARPRPQALPNGRRPVMGGGVCCSPSSKCSSGINRRIRAPSASAAAGAGCSWAELWRRCVEVVKQHKTRLYILRRCVSMLLCWRAHAIRINVYISPVITAATSCRRHLGLAGPAQGEADLIAGYDFPLADIDVGLALDLLDLGGLDEKVGLVPGMLFEMKKWTLLLR